MGFFIEADLIHDTRLFCTHLRIDGIEAMSSGTSGDKQVKQLLRLIALIKVTCCMHFKEINSKARLIEYRSSVILLIVP